MYKRNGNGLIDTIMFVLMLVIRLRILKTSNIFIKSLENLLYFCSKTAENSFNSAKKTPSLFCEGDFVQDLKEEW